MSEFDPSTSTREEKPWRPRDPRIAAWLDRVVAEAPPMTDDMCARVARILLAEDR